MEDPSQTDLLILYQNHPVDVLRDTLPRIQGGIEGASAFLGYYVYLVETTKIDEKPVFAEWGYPHLKAYILGEMSCRALSTIVDLKNNYEHFCVKSGISHEEYSRLSQKLGWSLLRDLRRKQMSSEELAVALRYIEENNLTQAEAREEIENLKKKEDGEGPTVEQWETFKCRVPAGKLGAIKEAIERVKDAEKTEDSGEALYLLAVFYSANAA